MRHAPARVAILINNTYVADARAWKTAVSLGKAGYHVTVIARWGPGLATTERLDHHTVTRVRQPQPLAWLPAPSLPETGDDGRGRTGGLRRRIRDSVGRAAQALRYLRMSRAWSKIIAEQVEAADVWQAESVITLSLAVALRKHFGGVVVYDANDIDSEAGRMARLPGPWKQLLRRHERRLARAADAVVTVSDPYAQILARILGRPVDAVVRNAARGRGPRCRADRRPTSERSDRFHDRFDLPPERRIVLYIGQVMRGRGLRQLFEAISLVDDADLVVAGFGPDYERYRTIAAALPHAPAHPLRRLGAAGRDPRVDARRGRLGHARPAGHAEPPLQHADQALRRHRRGRAGGGQQAAGHLAHRQRDRLRRALRPDRPGRRGTRHPSTSSTLRRKSGWPCACAASRLRAPRYAWQHQARELLRVYDDLGV